MVVKHHTREAGDRRPWAPLLVLILALLVSAAVTFVVARMSARQERQQFAERVGSISRAIDQQLHAYLDILRGTAGMLAATEAEISRERFRAYTEHVGLDRFYPRVRGIGWIPRVPAEGREAFVRAVEAMDLPWFEIWPETGPADSFPLLYLEPQDWQNLAAIGLDMRSERRRRAALERAWETGLPAVSSSVVLKADSPADAQPSFLVFVPVFGGATAAGPESLRGFAYGAFRAGDLLRGVLRGEPLADLDLAVYDGPKVQPERLLYRSAPSTDLRARQETIESIELAGQTWTLRFTSRSTFAAGGAVPFTALAGLLISSLLAAVTWSETRSRHISERAAAELRASRAAVERASRAKDDFTAMLGHELRNPLGAMSSALRLIRLRGGDDPPVERALAVLERQVRHQTRLVEDLLDVSRITTGRIRLNPRIIELNQLARDFLAGAVPPEGPRLVFVPSPEPARIEGDPLRLEQILANLVGNALEYTPREARVTVEVAAEGPEVRLTVSDEGMGISPEALPSIFELFTQAHEARGRSKGGLGIGLALVKELVELHGGRVEAESGGPGEGATFTVHLPRAEAHGSAAEVAVDDDARVEAASEGGARVLVVEDNPDAREMLAELLGMMGHRVAAAEDGVAGLDLALRWRPELAIVDLGLPGISGYEVARRVKEETGDIYMVALTGYGQAEDRDRALAAGFDEHMVKPLEIEELQRVLDHARRAPS